MGEGRVGAYLPQSLKKTIVFKQQPFLKVTFEIFGAYKRALAYWVLGLDVKKLLQSIGGNEKLV